MNYEERRRHTRATLVWGFVFLIILAIVILAWSDAKAEWVTVDQFGGIVTHASAAQLGFQAGDAKARKSVGWLYRSGELERANIDQLNTKPVLATGGKYILPSYLPSELLYYQGVTAHYSITQDTADIYLTARVDSVYTYQGDSTVRRHNWVEGFFESDWLQLAQSNITGVVLGTKAYEIWGFYDDSTLVLKDTADMNTNETNAKDTVALYFSTVNVGVANNPPDAFVANDTVWIVDGGRLGFFATDTAYTVTAPSCNPLITPIDTIWHAMRKGDSLLIYGNFTFSPYSAGQFWVLFGDTTLTSGAHMHGIPNRITAHLDDATGDERILVDADSAIYASYSDGGPWADDRHCLVGAWNPFYGDAMNLPRLRTVTGRLEYHGTYGTPSNQYGVLIPLDASWITSTRDWDCKSVLGAGIGWYYWFARIMSRNDSMMIYMWNGPPTPSLSSWNNDTVTFTFGIHDPYSVNVSPGVANEYSISCLHRRRAFYAGCADEPSKFTWSYQDHYDSIYTEGEKLEGDDPITNVSSLGQQAVLFRRHSIEYVTGFSTADFYKVPAPAGVGAASNHCVAKNPLDNSLYFINELGLFSYNGANVTEVPTGCAEIFLDSINWLQEKWIWAAVYDRKYWLACPFGTSMTNNRLIAFDLETGDVAFVGGINPGCVYTWSETQYAERLFIGDADSSVIWQMNGTTDDLYYSGDWRSGWYDGGDRSLQKRALEYRLCYDSDSGDTLLVDFYTDFSETAVWQDTIIATASGEKIFYAGVGRAVLGHAIGIGLQSPDEAVRVIDFGMEVVATGTRRKQ